MPKALITGITGQDGSHLAEFLLARDYRVSGLVRRSSGDNCQRLEGIRDCLTLHQGDLLDQTSLVRMLEQVQPDEVYNLAGMSFVAASWQQPVLTGEFTALLTYGGPGTNLVNRPLATAGIPRVRPLTIDEYPFASTLQGGAGSWIGHVPWAENTLQGQQLWNFYGYMNYRPFQFLVNVLGR